jgi:hypothetical protein
MILHIMWKDLRLLWRVVVLVGSVQAALTLMLFHIDHSATSKNPYGLLLQLILFVAFLGRAVLIVLCVQQDAIPGANQDWLTRPISRTDLLLAKISFVMLFVQGPVFLSDCLQAVANGAPISLSLAASFARTIFVTLIVTLPFIAFGAITENLTQAIAGAVIFFLALAGGQMLFVGLNEGRRILEVSPTTLTGLDWITDAIRLITALAAVAVVLAVQYFRRKTQFSRIVLAFGAVLCFAPRLLPWNAAYALQQHVTPSRTGGSAVALRFDPSRVARQSPSGVSKDLLQGQFGGTSDDTVIYIPVGVGGLPNGSLLKTDRVEARMRTPGGTIFDLGVGGDFQPLPQGEGTAATYSPIYVRNDLYRRYKDMPVDLEIVYSATEMTRSDAGEMDALHGKRNYRSIGSCTSRMNSSESQIGVRCLQPGTIPLCISALLRRSDSSAANPVVMSCAPNYAPVYPVMIPDGTSRFTATLPFRDPDGVGRYAIEGRDVSRSVVEVKVYKPAAHMQRTLLIAGIKLARWSSQ